MASTATFILKFSITLTNWHRVLKKYLFIYVMKLRDWVLYCDFMVTKALIFSMGLKYLQGSII